MKSHGGFSLYRSATTLRALICILMISLVTSSCGGGSGNADADSSGRVRLAAAVQVSESAVKVVKVVKVGELAVSGTVRDYVFQVSVSNDGPDLPAGVVVTLGEVSEGASVIDGSATFDAIPSGATVTSADTITIRQNRAIPIRKSAMTWIVSLPGSNPEGELPGEPMANANDNIRDVDTAEIYPSSEYSLDASGAQVLRTLVAIGIKDNATVQQVNAMLRRIGGRIVYASRGTGVIHVRLTGVVSLASLRNLLNGLSTDPAVEFTLETVVPERDALPAPETSLPHIRHHLAVRGAAAWNARRAAKPNAAPKLLIADYFGDGIPGSDNAIRLADAADFGSGKNELHGYHVLGIIAGSFGGSGPRGDVTGMYAGPDALQTKAIDLAKLRPPFESRIASEIRAQAAAGSRLVVNTSLNNPSTKAANNDRYSTTWAEYWARLIRGVAGASHHADIEDQYVHAASAGNIAGATRSAFHNSPWNAAALPERFSPAFARFDNLLAVENRRGVEGDQGRFVPGCALSASSFSGGNISAIGSWGNGTGIWSFTNGVSSASDTFVNALGNVQQIEGTSMAAPQVAGLAAYIWAIRTDLTAGQVVSIIKKNTYDLLSPCGGSPVIDAYAAILALDKETGLSSPDAATAPVRSALLDAVGEDGKFDVQDLAAFLAALFPTSPTNTADHGRFDLNGDGLTGGAGTARFNLNMDYESDGQTGRYGTISEAPDRTPLAKMNGDALDEAAVTDFQILCYYAHSKFYSGTLQEIETALSARSQVIGRDISCTQRVVTLKVNATNSAWSGLPATITLSNFVPRFPATSAGNSPTCTNQGALPGERGFPLFSAQVPSVIPIFAAIDVAGVPSILSGGSVNRRNCSSFFARSNNQVWINATGRAVFGFGSTVVSDWEYQVRYSNGDANGSGKQCVVGNVPGSGFFVASFSDSTCSHDEIVRVTD